MLDIDSFHKFIAAMFTFFHYKNQTQHLFGILFGFKFSYHFIIDQYPERLLPTHFSLQQTHPKVAPNAKKNLGKLKTIFVVTF